MTAAETRFFLARYWEVLTNKVTKTNNNKIKAPTHSNFFSFILSWVESWDCNRAFSDNSCALSAVISGLMPAAINATGAAVKLSLGGGWRFASAYRGHPYGQYAQARAHKQARYQQVRAIVLTQI